MATTTRAAGGSPMRRPLVWSQNTTYTGAAGVHSEVSRKTHALHVTNQRELNSNLSTIQSIHRKELQSLRQHRKSLESSMLAYTEKMRRISTDRQQLADPQGGHSNATLERLLTLNKQGNGSSANARNRISVDSGIDVEDTPQIEEVLSDMAEAKKPVTVNSKGMRKSASQPLLHQRPSFFNTLETLEDSSSDPAKVDRRRRVTTDQTNSSATRQRRSGTTDKPDILALKLSLGKPVARDGEENADRSSSTVPSDVSVAITPFPEFKLHVTNARGEKKAASSVADEDEDDERSQRTTSRTSLSSVKKSKKEKNNYWSYRKSPRRHSTTPRSGVTGKPEAISHAASPSPVSIPRKAIRGLIKGPQPIPVKPKPFHHSFRYSEAVEGVIKSIDASKDVDEKTLRRASEILPTLDIQNLREVRRRQQEETHKARTQPRPSVDLSHHQTLPAAGTESSESAGSEEGLVMRERGMSAPDILEHDLDSGCVSDGEGEEEGDGELKPVLRKHNSASRKSVQFLLPELSREAYIAV